MRESSDGRLVGLSDARRAQTVGRVGGRLLRLGSVRIIDGIVRRNCCWESQRRSTWRRERIYRWWSSSWIRAKAAIRRTALLLQTDADSRPAAARGVERMHASDGFEGHRFNLATSKAARRKKRTRRAAGGENVTAGGGKARKREPTEKRLIIGSRTGRREVRIERSRSA